MVENQNEANRLFGVFPLLRIKLHYFFAFGGLGGVIPFLSILIKSLGIDATAVGIIFTILPFTVLFAKPSFGILTDYLQNIKKVIICLLIAALTSYSCILLVPSVKSENNGIVINCLGNQAAGRLPISNKPICIEHDTAGNALCQAVSNLCEVYELTGESEQEISGTAVGFKDDKTRINFTLLFFATYCEQNKEKSESEKSAFAAIGIYNRSSVCDCLRNVSFSMMCSSDLGGSYSISSGSDANFTYRSFQFWIIIFLLMIGGTCSAAMFSLSDVACYEVLGNRPELYGKQRLWATISWGIFALLAGYLNDLKSMSSSHLDYSPGFFIMFVMAAIDIILLCTILDLKKSSFSSSIFEDIGSVFISHEVIIFSVGVFISGALCGILWTYENWFLQNLGASQLLLGLTVTVQCLVAEVPFFFFSGWIIRKLGHSVCLSLTLAAFALRYFLYSVLTNPWFVLPIEILHGWTFGVFYSTMTSFARHSAKPGTEATMQGVLGGLFEGLGVGVGSLLGGLGFDNLGGRTTFLCGAIFSGLCALVFTAATGFFKRRERKKLSELTQKGYGTMDTNFLRNT